MIITMLSRVFVYYFPGLNRASESWGSLQSIETHAPSSCEYSNEDAYSRQEGCRQSKKVLQRMHTGQVTSIVTTPVLRGTRIANRNWPEGILVCEWLSS